MAIKDHYEKKYGDWAGNPDGFKPDYSRCCAKVWADHRSHQCRNKNGQGPDGAYCGQHDPAVRERKDALAAYRFHKRSYDDRIRGLNRADEVIRAIANGHNDPRGLAEAWLEEMGDRLVAPTPPEAAAPPPPPPPPVKG